MHSIITCPNLTSSSTEERNEEQQNEQHQRLQQIVETTQCSVLSMHSLLSDS